MNNQISVTSKKHFVKTLFELSHKYLTLCSIYAIKVVTFIKAILRVQHILEIVSSLYIFIYK
jgi:hypothetical protein